METSETATASIAAMMESIAYKEGMVLLIASAEIERVIVRRSREARASSDSDSDPESGRVEVRGDATVATSIALFGSGAVTRIVGAWGCPWFVGVETLICRELSFWCRGRSGESGIPAAPTREGGVAGWDGWL